MSDPVGLQSLATAAQSTPWGSYGGYGAGAIAAIYALIKVLKNHYAVDEVALRSQAELNQARIEAIRKQQKDEESSESMQRAFDKNCPPQHEKLFEQVKALLDESQQKIFDELMNMHNSQVSVSEEMRDGFKTVHAKIRSITGDNESKIDQILVILKKESEKTNGK